eukprot:5420100-Prymnesium_polylepis.1
MQRGIWRTLWCVADGHPSVALAKEEHAAATERKQDGVVARTTKVVCAPGCTSVSRYSTGDDLDARVDAPAKTAGNSINALRLALAFHAAACDGYGTCSPGTWRVGAYLGHHCEAPGGGGARLGEASGAGRARGGEAPGGAA